METWRAEWTQQKKEIALNLAAGQCGGSYAEAVIILCAALSTLAADVWPGRGIDRVRFVQLLKDFAPNHFHANRVSIPLLVGHLRTNGRKVESAAIRKGFLRYHSSRILTGDDVDKPEAEILVVCPTLSLKELREHSYANLLYGEIRSAYVHEYRPGKRADSWPMTQRQDVTISYLNWGDEIDRHIHFPVRWISELALAVARAVDAAASGSPRNAPQSWWVHG